VDIENSLPEISISKTGITRRALRFLEKIELDYQKYSKIVKNADFLIDKFRA